MKGGSKRRQKAERSKVDFVYSAVRRSKGEFKMRKIHYFLGLVVVFTIFAVFTNVYAIHPDLVAAWTFDEGKGETAEDVTGNGLDGTLIGEPAWVDGVNGSALEIMGTAQYVVVQDSELLHFGEDDFTFMAWVNIDNYDGGNPSGLISKRTMTAGNGQPTLLWVVDNEAFAVEIQMRDDVAGVQILTGEEEVKEKEWHHVAMVKTDNEVIYYVDGVEDTSLDHGLGGSFTAEGFELYIGVHHYGNTWNCSLNGTIDEVGIFKKALMGAEIAALMKSLAPVEAAGKMGTCWGYIKSLY